MKKNKVHIICDVDGVLANTALACCNSFKKLFGIDILPEQIKAMPLIDNAALLHPVEEEREAVKIKLYENLAKEGTCTDIPVADGAKEFVEKMLNDPYVDFRILTAQFSHGKFWMWERSHWLKDHLNIPSKRIMFMKEKHPVYGDIFIDDDISNIIPWDEMEHGKSFLWNTLQNQEHNVPRLYSWQEAINEVEKIKAHLLQ